jgi:hypothetical protein
MSSDIEETGTKVIAGIIGLVSAVVVSLLTLWFIIYDNNDDNTPIQTLTTRCEENGGVMIEGVNDDGNNVSHFSICVPFEALTCVDVE